MFWCCALEGDSDQSWNKFDGAVRMNFGKWALEDEVIK